METMKTLITSLLIFISIISYGQEKAHCPDSVKTITLNEVVTRTLNDIDNNIRALQEKQTVYIKAIIEANGYHVENIKDFKYEGGKFIFIIEEEK